MKALGRLCVILALCALANFSLARLYDNNPHVVSFDEVTKFETEVAGGDSVWMIQFFSPNDPSSQALVPEFSTVGMLTRGILFVGAVDVTTDAGQEIAEKYGVRISAGPKIFFFGEEKKPKEFKGKNHAQDILQEFVQASVGVIGARAELSGSSKPKFTSSSSGGSSGSSKVVQLTTANFQEQVLDNPLVALVTFAAPWCGHCKNLLPEWEQAAKALDGEGAFLGWVDATAETELAQIYGVDSFPTIKVFPGGTGKTHADAMDYNSPRTVEAIVQVALAEVDRTGVPKPIPQLTSMEVLHENCAGQNHICVLAALPHILDSGADGRNAYMETFAKAAKQFRGSAFSFLWFEGTSQPMLEQTLEMTMFPTVAAFSMDKEAYVVMRTSFTEKNVASFLHGVTNGRQRIIKVSSMPEVVTTVPWDGLDAAPIEEEMPLCEIMGNCDEEGEL